MKDYIIAGFMILFAILVVCFIYLHIESLIKIVLIFRVVLPLLWLVLIIIIARKN